MKKIIITLLILLILSSSSIGLDISQINPPPPPGGIQESPDQQTTEPQIEECFESWTCEDWFDCIAGFQERICTDINFCGTEEFMPETLRECQEIYELGSLQNDILDIKSEQNVLKSNLESLNKKVDSLFLTALKSQTAKTSPLITVILIINIIILVLLIYVFIKILIHS